MSAEVVIFFPFRKNQQQFLADRHGLPAFGTEEGCRFKFLKLPCRIGGLSAPGVDGGSKSIHNIFHVIPISRFESSLMLVTQPKADDCSDMMVNGRSGFSRDCSY